MSPQSGDTIRERYTLREHLGKGGFATVWRAWDAERDRDVALKLPSLHNHNEETVLSRFDRERRLLEPFASGLSHGTLVQYLDGTLDTEPRYIALEYLAGDPLSETFSTGLGAGVRRRLVTDLAGTLDFLHRNEVVYLDLKPENVIVRPSGRPVLLDFNTAVRPSETVETVFEPDQFKAPELLVADRQTSPVGPWTDVFSWGKLAFYLLTGAKVPTENVPDDGLDPRSFGSTCSRELATVISRATAPDSDERYDDGMALAGAVAQATSRGRRLLVAHPSGVSCAVAGRDEFGRAVADEPTPWLVLADPEGHISPQHGQFEHSADGWVLADTSLNGTYVADSAGWTFALSGGGYQRRRERGEGTAGSQRPPTSVPLSDGATIAPVHPEYGIQLRVTTIDEETINMMD